MPRSRPCPERVNVLLIGGGGREHALAWKLAQSPRLGTLWASDTTNAGIAALATQCPAPMTMREIFHLKQWCMRNEIGLVVIGPEAPLAEGLADALQTEDRLVFGPGKAAARIEADKAYAKQIMRQAAIPTADARIFDRYESARNYLESRDEPLVVKASGLAAGKGAIVCNTQEDALEALDLIMKDRAFGDAGNAVVIEEKLSGQEVSVLALVDGRTIWVLDPAQDHKQVGEGDTGPNTGGMGAYCPAPVLDADTLRIVESEVLVPLVDALRRDDIEYRGVLYAGIMLTPGGPKVLEFNCRFGDPECQPLMARLRTDLLELCWATAAGTLDRIDVEFDGRTACCVVMCSEGYPGPYPKGRVIEGIEDAEALGDVIVFQAGTKRDGDDVVTNGGRVLGVTALADDLRTARDLANAACDRIRFDGAFYRRDIGDRVLRSAGATV